MREFENSTALRELERACQELHDLEEEQNEITKTISENEETRRRLVEDIQHNLELRRNIEVDRPRLNVLKGIFAELFGMEERRFRRERFEIQN